MFWLKVIEMHRCRDALVLLVAGKKNKRHTKLSNVFNTHIHTFSFFFTSSSSYFRSLKFKSTNIICFNLTNRWNYINLCLVRLAVVGDWQRIDTLYNTLARQADLCTIGSWARLCLHPQLNWAVLSVNWLDMLATWGNI